MTEASVPAPAVEKLDCTRYSWFCPPDPVWADREAAGKIRAALKQMDPKLGLWWCPDWRATDPEKPGRWGLVYYMQRAHLWAPIFYWEDAAGGFRPISTDCIDVLLRQLSELDGDREGNDVYSIGRAKEFLSGEAAKKRDAEFRDVMRQHALEYGMRLRGSKQTFGRGGRRNRHMERHAGKLDLGIDEDFEKFLRERGAR